MESNKYSKILDCLVDFTKRKTAPVLNILESLNEYPEIIWYKDIPEIILSEHTVNDESGYNIRITKPKAPRTPDFPGLSDVLEVWADKESLKDENGIPKLKSSIFVNGKTLYSTQYPQIEKELKDYVSDKWLDDLISYKSLLEAYEIKLAEFEKLNKFFDRLILVNDKKEKAGEDFETVFCVGLIKRKFSNNQSEPAEICRHLLSCVAEINFDSTQKEPVIEVKPDIESTIQIETDFLTGITDSEIISDAEKIIFNFLIENNIINNPFDIRIKEALKIFADDMKTGYNFKDDLSAPEGFTPEASIFFAPAIILRKKDYGGVTALYDRIIKAFNNAEETTEIEEKISELDKQKVLEEPVHSSSADAQNPESVHDDKRIKFDSRPDLMSLPEFLVFTTFQNAYKVQNKGFKNKFQILTNIAFEAGERPIFVTGTRNYSGYLLVAFENGKLGKITMESFKTETKRTKLKSAFNNESPLVYIDSIQEDIDLVAISSIDKVVLFNSRLINPVGSKTTKGFQVLKSKDGSIMINVKRAEHVKLQDPSYYRRDEGLNVVGFYLKQGDEIN